MLWQRQPLEEATSDEELPARTRALLGLVARVRDEARRLGLEVDGQYTSYVDWPGDRVVTTLVRTRRGSLEAEPWWFPFLGELPYKGYFDRARAEAEAERMLEEGEYEVCVSGVAAYSTLGWLDDPVTGPMLARGAAYLVETIFHELVHATAFVPEQAEFNEGVAQFIGQQAAIRFFAKHPASPFPIEAALAWPDADRVRDAIADRREIAQSMLAFKTALHALEGRPDRPERRREAEQAAREGLAALPLLVLDAERVAERARLSDACLALRGTYAGDAERHANVYAALGESLPRMIERLRVWAEEERPTEAFFEVDSALGDASGTAAAAQ